MPDHVHMLLRSRPNTRCRRWWVSPRARGAIDIARVYGERKRNFVGQHFWARGFFVNTVGRDEEAIRRNEAVNVQNHRSASQQLPPRTIHCSLGRRRSGQPERKPREISADAGYCSEDNLLALATRKIHAYVATGRAKHPTETTRKVGGEMTQKMRQKLKRADYRSRYRLRKQIVEPVFGQIKQARGFRQFLLRGLEAVQAEWALICTAHNITKLAKAI